KDAWKIADGIKFTFPENTVIPAGGIAVIAKADPTIFKERAGLPQEVQVFGPYKGALRNQGESVSLRQAVVDPTSGDIEYKTVDRVVYDDATPWPTLASQGASSIQRVDDIGYGNDAINWLPSVLGGTAGLPNISVDTSPRSIPMVESFSKRLDELSGWTFTSGPRASWEMLNGQLQTYIGGCRSCSVEESQTTATITLDVESADDLALLLGLTNVWTGQLDVDISDDQRTWYSVYSGPLYNSGTFAFDLSGPLAEHGLTGPGVRYLRLRHSGVGAGAYYDAVSVISQDVLGPWVADSTILTDDNGGVTGIELTFDEPIDPESFTAQVLEIRSPIGDRIRPETIHTDDGVRWSIDFPPVMATGTFSFVVQPEVKDLAGNYMNRYEYSVDRRSPQIGATLSFEQSITVHEADAQQFPFASDFENRISDWTFSSGPGASWSVQADDERGQVLRLRQLDRPASTLTTSAELPLDLSGLAGRDDLSFDFWAKGGMYLSVAASNNGIDWQPIYGTGGTPNFQQYSFDLDETLLELGIEIDSSVRLRFEQPSTIAGTVYLSDVRVGSHDVFGPSVETVTVFHDDDLFENVAIVFNESIAIPTESDISVRNPVGRDIAPEDIRVVGGNVLEFRLPKQQLSGTYEISVSRDITDVHGNRMNQSANPISGEVWDGYSTTFEVDLIPTFVYPYDQTFSDVSIEGLEGWAFTSLGDASWQVEDGHLQGTTSNNGSIEAILNIDLTNHADDERVSLQFSAMASSDVIANLFVSGASGRWYWVSELRPERSTEVVHSFDLKRELRKRGLPLDENAKVMVQATTYRRRTNLFIDNVRINGEEIFGPRIIRTSTLQELEDGQSKVTVTFDKPIDAATFTAEDARLELTGGKIDAANVQQIDEQAFDVYFPTPE
ncbi:MAG: hypothetical protein KDB27_28750, partial [Planctomycetales bacterium]|nr:hypothetical protein [Planctomycetales bacterium]